MSPNTTKPSSPREFFKRLYGHLESKEKGNNGDNGDNNETSVQSDTDSVRKFVTYEETSSNYASEVKKRTNIDDNCNYEENSDKVEEDEDEDDEEILQKIECDNPKNKRNVVENNRHFVPELSPGFNQNGNFLTGYYPLHHHLTPIIPPTGTPMIFPASYLHDFAIPPAADTRVNNYSAFLERKKRKEGRPRRQRTTFSTDQTSNLEKEYAKGEYINRDRRAKLAEMLNLSEGQVKIWFQNRRAKAKRLEKTNLDQHLRSVAVYNLPFPINWKYDNLLYGFCVRKTPMIDEGSEDHHLPNNPLNRKSRECNIGMSDASNNSYLKATSPS